MPAAKDLQVLSQKIVFKKVFFQKIFFFFLQYRNKQAKWCTVHVVARETSFSFV